MVSWSRWAQINSSNMKWPTFCIPKLGWENHFSYKCHSHKLYGTTNSTNMSNHAFFNRWFHGQPPNFLDSPTHPMLLSFRLHRFQDPKALPLNSDFKTLGPTECPVVLGQNPTSQDLPGKRANVPWKSMVGRCISYSFLGDMLVFGGCKSMHHHDHETTL